MDNRYLAEKTLVDDLRWVEDLERVRWSTLNFGSAYLRNGSGIRYNTVLMD
jgi:hypothetical protein